MNRLKIKERVNKRLTDSFANERVLNKYFYNLVDEMVDAICDELEASAKPQKAKVA